MTQKSFAPLLAPPRSQVTQQPENGDVLLKSFLRRQLAIRISDVCIEGESSLSSETFVANHATLIGSSGLVTLADFPSSRLYGNCWCRQNLSDVLRGSVLSP